MRIWDIAAGYLSRQSLLGEHRELHGLHSILVHGKTGYSRHPETLRWVGHLPALVRRHAWLVAEMRLRGYEDRTPLLSRRAPTRSPERLHTAAEQYALLRGKYGSSIAGRIPLPTSVQHLWAHHKYSVLARDPSAYQTFGRRAARHPRQVDFTVFAEDLVTLLHQAPAAGRLHTAIEHMWGHLSRLVTPDDRRDAQASPAAMFRVVQEIAVLRAEPYLLTSTALSELAVFIRNER